MLRIFTANPKFQIGIEQSEHLHSELMQSQPTIEDTSEDKLEVHNLLNVLDYTCSSYCHNRMIKTTHNHTE